MPIHEFTISSAPPYFAELPYYLWGSANYDSEGDCERPTDRSWTWMELERRVARHHLRIASDDSRWKCESEEPWASRAMLFLRARCGAIDSGNALPNSAGHWDHEAAMHRAARVAAEFARPELEPFDSHLFWGSWKWIGWFATEFTWVGRWIMLSVLKNDKRGVPLCIEWLAGGTFNEAQSSALRYALARLTGISKNTDKEWIRWYRGGLFATGHQVEYQKPDFDAWLGELKVEYADCDTVDDSVQ